MTRTNQRVIFSKRPTGAATPDVFTRDSQNVPDLRPNEYLIRVCLLSMDPALVGRMRAESNYIESANPAQGRLRGPTNEALIVEGVDRYYTRAGELGLLYVPFGEEGSPLDERVGRHIQTVSMLLEVFSSYNPDRTIAVENLPTLDDVLLNGLGAFLAPPPN